MKENKISLINKFNEKLIGLESIPKVKKKKYPTILLVHGFGATKGEHGFLKTLSNMFVNNGFLTYRFDFSGCGESEGVFSETSLSKQISDFKQIFSFVNKQKIVDKSKIGVFAFSFGVLPVSIVNPMVKCFAFSSTSPYPEKVLRKIFGKGYNPHGVSVRKSSRGFTQKLNAGFWKDLKKYNLFKAVSKIKKPILFLHGSKDSIVNLKDMAVYFDAVKSEKQKIIIKGGNHWLTPESVDAFKLIVGWFKSQI